MAAEKDETAWLPEPPPPGLAHREAAIGAALRKFDGTEEASPLAPERSRRSWARTHRTQLGFALSVLLIVMIGIPASLIGLREQQPASEKAPPPMLRYESEPAGNGVQPEAAAPSPQRAPSSENAVAEVTPPAASSASEPAGQNQADLKAVASNEPSEGTSGLAAAPPPPPPPPPAPAVASAERDAGPAAQDVVVTGTRVARPNFAAPADRKKSDAFERAPGGEEASAMGAYRAFLSRLQTAVRDNDRRAIVRLTAFPLRVNSNGSSRLYRNGQAIERDFDLIFTASVRRAILAQKPDQLFVRDQGAMIGSGQLWFDRTCPDDVCSSPGPVRIKAVNP
jgi:hypothetical protein